MQIEYTAAEDSVFFWIFTQKNEVGFDGQRSLLHSPTKPTSFGIEACCPLQKHKYQRLNFAKD